MTDFRGAGFVTKGEREGFHRLDRSAPNLLQNKSAGMGVCLAGQRTAAGASPRTIRRLCAGIAKLRSLAPTPPRARSGSMPKSSSGELNEPRSDRRMTQNGLKNPHSAPQDPHRPALGFAACQKGHSVTFTTAAALVHELMEARDERRLRALQSISTWSSC